MDKIQIAPIMTRKLAKEFGVTTMAIYMAVRYFTNSELAQNIRARAKELLIEEANRVIITIDKN